MCPAGMATQPEHVPNTSPSQAPIGPNGSAYDNADYGEALVLGHGNQTHLPSADNPFYDPDTFYSLHSAKGANFLFGDGLVHFLSSSINPLTYQYLCTIAGGENFPTRGEPPLATEEIRHARADLSCFVVLPVGVRLWQEIDRPVDRGSEVARRQRPDSSGTYLTGAKG